MACLSALADLAVLSLEQLPLLRGDGVVLAAPRLPALTALNLGWTKAVLGPLSLSLSLPLSLPLCPSRFLSVSLSPSLPRCSSARPAGPAIPRRACRSVGEPGTVRAPAR